MCSVEEADIAVQPRSSRLDIDQCLLATEKAECVWFRKQPQGPQLSVSRLQHRLHHWSAALTFLSRTGGWWTRGAAEPRPRMYPSLLMKRYSDICKDCVFGLMRRWHKCQPSAVRELAAEIRAENTPKSPTSKHSISPITATAALWFSAAPTASCTRLGGVRPRIWATCVQILDYSRWVGAHNMKSLDVLVCSITTNTAA